MTECPQESAASGWLAAILLNVGSGETTRHGDAITVTARRRGQANKPIANNRRLAWWASIYLGCKGGPHLPYDEEIVHNERLPDEEAWLSFGVAAIDGVLQDALLKETHRCRRR